MGPSSPTCLHALKYRARFEKLKQIQQEIYEDKVKFFILSNLLVISSQTDQSMHIFLLRQFVRKAGYREPFTQMSIARAAGLDLNGQGYFQSSEVESGLRFSKYKPSALLT